MTLVAFELDLTIKVSGSCKPPLEVDGGQGVRAKPPMQSRIQRPHGQCMELQSTQRQAIAYSTSDNGNKERGSEAAEEDVPAKSSTYLCSYHPALSSCTS